MFLKPKERKHIMKLIRYKYPNTTGCNSLSRLFKFETPPIERFGKLFDELLGSEADADQLPVDLYEDNKNFYVRMELPGVDKDAINLELENAVLTCSGNYSEKTKNGNTDYSFKRSISIPDEAVADQISANQKDGVLTVTIPKKEVAEARRIKVK
jgi:HSP20 family protein